MGGAADDLPVWTLMCNAYAFVKPHTLAYGFPDDVLKVSIGGTSTAVFTPPPEHVHMPGVRSFVIINLICRNFAVSWKVNYSCLSHS
jgi:hypothetical protein